MNNARYFELIDTVGQRPPRRGHRRRHPRRCPRSAWSPRCRAATSREVGYPEPGRRRAGRRQVGTSSVVYRVGLFQGDGDEAGRRGPLRARVRRQHRPARARWSRCRTRSAPPSSRCCGPDARADWCSVGDVRDRCLGRRRATRSVLRVADCSSIAMLVILARRRARRAPTSPSRTAARTSPVPRGSATRWTAAVDAHARPSTRTSRPRARPTARRLTRATRPLAAV